jgi:hypothetical protein
MDLIQLLIGNIRVGGVLPSLLMKKDTAIKQRAALISDISKTRAALDDVQNRFDYETDSDLIDACIFERNALEARYRHLLSLARKQMLTNDGEKVIIKEAPLRRAIIGN